MALTIVGIVLLLVSAGLFTISYKMYSYYGLLQDGNLFVRVQTADKVYYGWVKRNEVISMDKITFERMQWFIELRSKSKYVIRIEDIREIVKVGSPLVIVFRGALNKVKP